MLFDDVRMYLEISLFVVVVLLFGILLAGGLYVALESPACHDLAAVNVEYNYRFTFWNGCLVQTADNIWIDADLLGVKQIE